MQKIPLPDQATLYDVFSSSSSEEEGGSSAVEDYVARMKIAWFVEFAEEAKARAAAQKKVRNFKIIQF